MTVAALVRGKPGTYNALVVDTGVGTFGANPDPTYECEHDKIRLAFGNTYFCAVGDAMLLDSLRWLVAWLDPKRPDLRDPVTMDALLTGVERLRTIKLVNHGGAGLAPDPGSANLVVCSRVDAFYWMSEYDVATGKYSRPEAPVQVPPGEAVVVWGSNTDAHCRDFPTTPQDPFRPIVDLMLMVDKDCQAKGFNLPYKLKERCSGVVLPHKTSEQLRRVRPFDSLPEALLRYNGDRAMALLSDPAFMEFPMPEAK